MTTMEIDLKKYFWIVTAITVLVCAVFAAKSVNHIIEAKYLGETKVPVVTTPKPKQKTSKKTVRSKTGRSLVARNMFCSSCEESAEQIPDPAPVESDPDGNIPVTSLPLRLVATNMVVPLENSFATIRNTTSAHQGAYVTGDVIPNAGEVKEIHGKYVYFQNKRTRKLEQIALLEKGAVKRPTTSRPTRKATARSNKDELSKAINAGVRKISDTEFEVDRALVDRFTQDPSIIKGARIVPSLKNGKPKGFRLYAIRPNSIFAKIGIRNGDTIHAINSFELKSLSDGLEIYGKLQSASNISVAMTRRGKSITLNYTIR